MPTIGVRTASADVAGVVKVAGTVYEMDDSTADCIIEAESGKACVILDKASGLTPHYNEYTQARYISLKPAKTNTPGAVIVGSGLSVTANGTISVACPATTTHFSGITGSTMTIDNETSFVSYNHVPGSANTQINNVRGQITLMWNANVAATTPTLIKTAKAVSSFADNGNCERFATLQWFKDQSSETPGYAQIDSTEIVRCWPVVTDGVLGIQFESARSKETGYYCIINF